MNITKYTHDNHPECGACPTREELAMLFLFRIRKLRYSHGKFLKLRYSHGKISKLRYSHGYISKFQSRFSVMINHIFKIQIDIFIRFSISISALHFFWYFPNKIPISSYLEFEGDFDGVFVGWGQNVSVLRDGQL